MEDLLWEPAEEYSHDAIRLESYIGVVILTHMDTRVREFGGDHDFYDHTEHRITEMDEIPDLTRWLGKIIGFTPHKDIQDFLFEHNYPRLFLPRVDKETYYWYWKQQTGDIDTDQAVDLLDLETKIEQLHLD